MHPVKLTITLFLFMCIGEYVMALGATDNNASARITGGTKLEQMMLKAIQGDGEAASKVAYHFSAGRQDLSKGDYWFLIGAENNHVVCQFNIAYALNHPPLSDTATIRGIYWLKLSLRNGVDDDNDISLAKNELNRLGIDPGEPFPDDLLFRFDNPVLNDDQLEQCTTGALQGSQKAALVLAEHYRAVNDMESAEYWYRIGAQNGSAECQFIYGHILAGRAETLDRERGKFWLNRATENGYHGQ
jgi:TPR repeat protein